MAIFNCYVSSPGRVTFWRSPMWSNKAMWCPSFLSGDPLHQFSRGMWSLWIVWCLSYRGFDVLYFGKSFSRFHLFNIYIYTHIIHILCMYIYIYCILYYIICICMYIILINNIWYNIYTQNWGSKLLFWNLGFQLVRVDLDRVYCFLWELWVPSIAFKGTHIVFSSSGGESAEFYRNKRLKWLDLANSQRLIEYKQFPKLGRRQYPNIFLL